MPFPRHPREGLARLFDDAPKVFPRHPVMRKQDVEDRIVQQILQLGLMPWLGLPHECLLRCTRLFASTVPLVRGTATTEMGRFGDALELSEMWPLGAVGASTHFGGPAAEDPKKPDVPLAPAEQALG